MTFVDRNDAGRELGAALARLKISDPVVLALPRGGVPVAAKVAEALGAPLDLVIVRKIGAPYQPELALGAIVDAPEPVIVRNEHLIAATGISDAEFNAIAEGERAEIKRRRWRYLGGRHHVALAGRVVIVVDDGIATGATMRAALRAIRELKPKRLILAVPVAPPDILEELRPEADEAVCLEKHDPFGAVGFFYRDFRQVSDQEVVDLLERHGERPAGEPPVTEDRKP